ncbi:hypothetical protein J437_LFUL014096 [Ladona fulva]|uniref:Cytochrome P450 n=1 Tax=Ladona fulva TaxID=123851 RepID=A0A8K0KKC8_LADFU|nr:hypothetical protein J437_LFUL014096 [Ladona fulva]
MANKGIDLAVQEVEMMLGDKLERGEEITLRDLNTLEYLERCVKESLRLFPVVPLIARDLKTPLKIGTTVVVATYILHRDPKVFPNPEKFDPDRFCRNEDRNPYAYAPFSAGSRNCIGQKFAMVEVKLMLAKVLLNFEIQSIEKRRQLKLQGEIVLNNQNGVQVSVSKRKKNNNK